MHFQAFVNQPAGGVDYLALFRQALGKASFARFDAAVAYATLKGVLALDKACRDWNTDAWNAMKKRWLVGIDYCRTEPLAIQHLQKLPNSKVRIHAGREVVARKLCTPVLPFHPKVYLLRGRGVVGAICGSGNLSLNGLTKGHEVGNVMLTDARVNGAGKLIAAACGRLGRWYEATWSAASGVAAVYDQYEKVVEAAEHLKAPTPTDDDTGETDTLDIGMRRRRALTPADLRRLRVCKNLWLEAGNVTKNRGEVHPGNQLMLTRMTRVFFGFPAQDLPKDSPIGNVRITYDGETRDNCSLMFSNNAMDKLTVPVPDDGGPPRYDNKNLLFTKQRDGTFVLTLGSNANKAAWKRASLAIDGYKRMSGKGRQWGVF